MVLVAATRPRASITLVHGCPASFPDSGLEAKQIRHRSGWHGRCAPRAWGLTLEFARPIGMPGPAKFHRQGRGEVAMLWTIAVLLFLLWLGGMISNYTLGGFIHVLLLLAIASILIRVIQGRRPV